MLCVRRQSRQTEIGGVNTSSPRVALSARLEFLSRGFGEPSASVPDTGQTIAIPTTNKRFSSKFRGQSLGNLDIESVHLDFERGKIHYSFNFNTSIAPECSPLDVLPLITAHEYPFEKVKKEHATITVDCELDNDLFSYIVTGGRGGNISSSYSGDFLDSAFISYILSDTQVPQIQSINCERKPLEIDKCTFLKGIMVAKDVIKYIVDFAGSPSVIYGPRISDDIPNVSNFTGGIPNSNKSNSSQRGSNPLDESMLHPDLQQDMVTAYQITQDVDGRQNADTEVPVPARNVDDGQQSQGGNICGFSPSIEYEQIKPVFSFNMSFFGEKLLDVVFFARIYTLVDLAGWSLWKILPLGAEWKEWAKRTKKLFSLDLNGDGECIPPPLADFIDTAADIMNQNTTCKFELTPVAIFRCVLYNFICLMRKFRDFLIQPILTFYTFVNTLLTTDLNDACKAIKSLSLGGRVK